MKNIKFIIATLAFVVSTTFIKAQTLNWKNLTRNKNTQA
jgi:hypothetical protein